MPGLPRHRGPYSDGRLSTYAFFIQEKTAKEKADFLKERYGIGGCSHALSGADDSHADYDGKGIKLCRGDYLEPAATELLKWPQAAKRVQQLIDQGMYLKAGDYSRMPVYLESKDNVKGIIYAKDLLPYIGSVDDSFQWQSLVRKPFFVPESRMIDDILEDFRKKKIHMAIVVDEYGGTQGLVTLEDVLEEIVGEINDEYDEDEKFYTRLSPDTYVFQGKTQLNDFYRVTGLEASDFDGVAEDAETVAGLLLNIKHDFPGDKETIEYGRCRFIVLDVAKFRINSVKVKVAPKDDAKKGEDDEQER